jgi:hypothetical protein
MHRPPALAAALRLSLVVAPPSAIDAQGAFDWEARVGALVTRAADQHCVSIREAALAPGSELVLADPMDSAAVVVGVVERRRWHRYVYLGYDVEPSCDDRDFRDPSAASERSASTRMARSAPAGAEGRLGWRPRARNYGSRPWHSPTSGVHLRNPECAGRSQS